MADDIRCLRHTARELNEVVDMLFETYARKEIDDKFAEIMQKLTFFEEKTTSNEL